MMSYLNLLALAGAMAVLAGTPGPGVFATVSSALGSGFRKSVLVAAGIVTGDLIFLLSAIYGLSALAQNLHEIFLVIKYLGAGYLIYLGFKIWFTKPKKMDVTESKVKGGFANYISGLLITLGNPKVIVFYLGFLPAFVDLEKLNGFETLQIALVVSGVLGGIMLFYGYTASKSRRFFQSPKSQVTLNRTAGSTMIATGAVIAIKS